MSTRWPTHPRGSRSMGRKIRVTRTMAHNPGPNFSKLAKQARTVGANLGLQMARAETAIKKYYKTYAQPYDIKKVLKGPFWGK